MKLLLVSPPFGEKGQRSKGLPIAPPVLEYMAGLTRQLRPDVEIRLLDANKEPLVCEDVAEDAIAFTVLTPQAPWVFRTADALRALGRRVVLGGVHVSVLPDEARLHADAVVVGEAEAVWGQVLDDLRAGRPEPIYHGHLGELDGLPRPITNLWGRRYVYGYFQTSRGCPHRCTFCSVHRFFGGKARVRPIDDVVNEVAASRYRLFWGIDDNIWGVNTRRSIELYEAMARGVSGKWWFGSGDLVSVQGKQSERLLGSARRAGLTAVLVGWESNNPSSLEHYNAASKQGRERRDAVMRIRDSGIEVMLFVMLGGRQDTRRDFDSIRELCHELRVSAHPVMATPFPGTEMYEAYLEHIYPGLDWDRFDGNRAVYEHPTLGPAEREDLLVDLRASLFSLPQILGRVSRVGWRGFPMSHITSFMIQYPQGRAFRQFAADHYALRASQPPLLLDRATVQAEEPP